MSAFRLYIEQILSFCVRYTCFSSRKHNIQESCIRYLRKMEKCKRLIWFRFVMQKVLLNLITNMSYCIFIKQHLLLQIFIQKSEIAQIYMFIYKFIFYTCTYFVQNIKKCMSTVDLVHFNTLPFSKLHLFFFSLHQILFYYR